MRSVDSLEVKAAVGPCSGFERTVEEPKMRSLDYLAYYKRKWWNRNG